MENGLFVCDYCVEKVIPMKGKGTGKYYAPVYRAKKSPLKLRRIRLIRRCAAIAAAVAIVAVSIAAFQINKDDSSSFVKVAASEQSLAGVSSYPRIVNHSSPLSESYVPENLMSLGTLPNGDNIFLRADAAEAFLDMCAAMSEDGLGIVPVKGYVSYEDQSDVLTRTADRLIAEGATPMKRKKSPRPRCLPPVRMKRSSARPSTFPYRPIPSTILCSRSSSSGSAAMPITTDSLSDMSKPIGNIPASMKSRGI